MSGYLLFKSSGLLCKSLTKQSPFSSLAIGLRLFGRAHIEVPPDVESWIQARGLSGRSSNALQTLWLKRGFIRARHSSAAAAIRAIHNRSEYDHGADGHYRQHLRGSSPRRTPHLQSAWIDPVSSRELIGALTKYHGYQQADGGKGSHVKLTKFGAPRIAPQGRAEAACTKGNPLNKTLRL